MSEQDPERVKAKVIDLLSHARKKAPARPRAAAAPTMTQSGSHNVQVGRDLTINHHAPARVIVKAEPRPGSDHITEAQCATLKRLVDAIVDLENATKRAPRKHAAVWAALNRRMHAASYRFIPLADYDTAEASLRREIGRLNNSATARKMPGHRAARIKAIQAHCQEHGLQERRHIYMLERFGAESLTALTDAQVEQVYAAVMRWT